MLETIENGSVENNGGLRVHILEFVFPFPKSQLIDCFSFFSFCYCSGLESDSSPSNGNNKMAVAIDGGGAGSDHPRGVRPVYLRCSQGSVSWLYPRGALRVVLRYGTAGKEFQVNNTCNALLPLLVCFKEEEEEILLFFFCFSSSSYQY